MKRFLPLLGLLALLALTACGWTTSDGQGGSGPGLTEEEAGSISAVMMAIGAFFGPAGVVIASAAGGALTLYAGKKALAKKPSAKPADPPAVP